MKEKTNLSKESLKWVKKELKKIDKFEKESLKSLKKNKIIVKGR